MSFMKRQKSNTTLLLTLGEGEMKIYRKKVSILNSHIGYQLKNVTLAALHVFQLYFTAHFNVRIKIEVSP